MYAVYIREAHPSDGWKMSNNDSFGIAVEQPKSQDARNLVASRCATTLDLSMPLLVDTIDDSVNKLYSGFPDRLYLIDRNGMVIYKGGRGPYGYKARELEQSLVMMLLDEHLAQLEETKTAPAASGAPAQTPAGNSEPNPTEKPASDPAKPADSSPDSKKPAEAPQAKAPGDNKP